MRLAPWGGAHRFPVAPPPTVVALNMNVYKLKQIVILIIAITILSNYHYLENFTHVQTKLDSTYSHYNYYYLSLDSPNSNISPHSYTSLSCSSSSITREGHTWAVYHCTCNTLLRNTDYYSLRFVEVVINKMNKRSFCHILFSSTYDGCLTHWKINS